MNIYLLVINMNKAMQGRWGLFVLISFALWACAQADCGSQLTNTVDVDVATPNIIKKLLVNSIYPFTVVQGDAFRVEFTGTNSGEATWEVSGATVSMGIGTPPTTLTPGAPSGKPVVSASQSLVATVAQVVLAIGGVFAVQQSGLKGLFSVFVCLICIGSLDLISTADGPACPDATVKIYIPSGKVQTICDDKKVCQCGPDYSGPNCDFYKAKCIPTAQQLANRLNFDTAFAPEDIPLPDPGTSICDSNFGSEIWRVSNREPQPDLYFWIGDNNTQTFDQRITINGAAALSPGNKYLMAARSGGDAFVYEVNMDEYNVPHIDPTKRIYLSLTHEVDGLWTRTNYIGVDHTRGAWLTETEYVFVYYDKVFKVDVSQPQNERGGLNCKMIGDLAPFMVNNYYPATLDDFGRCSNARRGVGGSALRMMCDVGYGVGTLAQPDYTKVDSHSPNATCINAQWGDGYYGKIGYVIFDIMDANPADYTQNIKMWAKFINGVDSDEWYCFQSSLQWSTEYNMYRTWVMYNGLNNGYKVNIDRSGEWITCAATDRPDILGWSWPYINPSYRMKSRPLAEGGGVIFSRVHGYEGHGAMGWGESIIQSSAPDPCGTCVGYYKFDQIPDDDPDRYNGTCLLGLGFNGPNNSPWRYSLGMYASLFHATAESKGEGVLQGGCDRTQDFDCDTIPRAAELMRIIPNIATGGGVIERIASTRDGGYTLYAIVTSECEVEGPCWVAFQSTWGAKRGGLSVAYIEQIPSDIFIVRFR